MAILTPADFTGKHLIVQTNIVEDALTDIIEDAEKRYLRAYLGDDLYINFIAGLEENVIKDKWVNLRDGIDYIEYSAYDEKGDNTCKEVFRGLKEMLKYLIRIEWNNYVRFQQSSTGLSSSAQELGNTIDSDSFQSVQQLLFNEALKIVEECVYYIYEQNYPMKIDSIVNGLVTCKSTRGLMNGDIVKINNVDYTVANVTDTTFTCDATQGDSWQIYFYPNFQGKTNQRKQVIGVY